MKITSKGQVTIPKKFRDLFQLVPYTDVVFEVKENELRIKKSKQVSRSQILLVQMKGKATRKINTDEILSFRSET